jgi:hypothetical protein
MHKCFPSESVQEENSSQAESDETSQAASTALTLTEAQRASCRILTMRRCSHPRSDAIFNRKGIPYHLAFNAD